MRLTPTSRWPVYVALMVVAAAAGFPVTGLAAEPAPLPIGGQAGKSCLPIFNGVELICVPVKAKTIFVTSEKYDGDLRTAGMGLNGLQGADNICNAHALNGIVPPGHYVAWLSTDDKNARDRLRANGAGYALPDGTPVAADKPALLNAEQVDLLSPINQDEHGAFVDTQTVWTGTSADGTRSVTGYNCYDWTLNQSGVESGTAGETFRTDRRWTIQWSVTCQAKLPLYCIQR